MVSEPIVDYSYDFITPNSNLHSSPTVTTMVVLPQEEWQSMHDKLYHLTELIANRNVSDRNVEWLICFFTYPIASPKIFRTFVFGTVTQSENAPAIATKIQRREPKTL